MLEVDTLMPPKNVRSTVLISSRVALEQSGRFDEYQAHLKEADRASLRELIAGVWVPVHLADVHYAACESLGLRPADQHAIGCETGRRVNGTLLGTIARLAHSAGVTPWTLLDQLPRFWSRGFDGGNVLCEKLGPKEARVTIGDQPLLRYSYFRNGLAGTAQEQLRPFCARAYVRVERLDGGSIAHYRYQWA
jgi:hypothetical protein